MISRLVIVGVGLIGGSVALALRKAGMVETIVGVGRSKRNLLAAKNLKIIDEATQNLGEAVESADMIILAAPVRATKGILEELAPLLSGKEVVTDVGSVKGQIVAAAKQSLGGSFSRFVPGHPIAGSEERGASSAFADLFVNHHVLLTPSRTTDPEATEKVKTMWEATGAIVSQIDEETHDIKLAVTSHLPHALAYSLMNLIVNEGGEDSFKGLMGGGFRDTTRIAASDPEIWTDIFISNREQILSAYLSFKEQLSDFMDALEKKDDVRILRFIELASKTRQRSLIPNANTHKE